MTKDSALRMALEALKLGDTVFYPQTSIAIAVIEGVLAQPEKDIPKIGCVNHDCDKCKAQPEQEPEDLTIAYMAGLSRGKDLAPQRKPLTDEQRNWIVATCPTPRHIIDTVEKMHGIKE